MSYSRILSTVLAAGLVLGSAGAALAKSHGISPNNYQTFLAGGGTIVTDPNAKFPAASQDPFALYGFPGGGRAIGQDHIATAADNAKARVDPDPFE